MAGNNLWNENGDPQTLKITTEDWEQYCEDKGYTLEQQMEMLKETLRKNGVKPAYWKNRA
tara:strand:- start:248 stop:427 length:180 start_codon:yes stop_codon:yes gene_type:complete